MGKLAAFLENLDDKNHLSHTHTLSGTQYSNDTDFIKILTFLGVR